VSGAIAPGATTPGTTAPGATAPTAAPVGNGPSAVEPARKSTTQWGLGPGYAMVIPLGASKSESAGDLGVALEVARVKPVSERVDVSFRFAWGLTTWDRFRRWSRAAYGVGAWTTEAYRDVYGWMGAKEQPAADTTKDGDSRRDNTRSLRVVGGGIALVFLSLGYVASGFTYAASVVAPTTWMELDFAGHYNFGDRSFNPYVKGGVGMLAFLHPTHGTLVGGVGPHLGGGLQIGSFLHAGASVTWSPPALHGEPRDGRSHLLVGSLTLGTQN
jgi:hypothetical protein